MLYIFCRQFECGETHLHELVHGLHTILFIQLNGNDSDAECFAIQRYGDVAGREEVMETHSSKLTLGD